MMSEPMALDDYWPGAARDGCCWWALTPFGPMALPPDLAAAWHDAGTRPVVLATHADAAAVAGWGDRAADAPAATAGGVAGLFDGVAA
jgi:hypothetical protein